MNFMSHLSDITKILLVENDQEDVLIFRNFMKDEAEIPYPYEIDNTTTLQQSLQKLAEIKYDIIFLDLSLSDSKGLNAFTQIRHHHFKIPIVVLTGLSDQNTALETLSAGAQDYMVKGTFNGRAIRRVIRYSIERNQLLKKIEHSSEERFRNLIEQDSDGMMVTDLEGKVLLVNPAALTLLNSSETELIGKAFPYPVGPDSHTEIEVKSPNSEVTRSIEMRVNNIDWKKKPAFLASIHDITETREIERLKAEITEKEKMDKLKDNFISIVSHEIKTPLTIIKAALSNLGEGINGPITDKQQEVLNATLRNVDRLNKILKDILDLSRLESGRSTINITQINLKQLIDEIKFAYVKESTDKNIAINFDLPENLPTIESDPDMILQVLNNLLSNALHYAHAQITLKAEFKQNKSENFIEVTISDDGEGIPADKIHLLFEKFEQINRPMGGAGYKGTGLGLAISKQIIEHLQGNIWAVCNGTHQTEFHFTLPLKQNPA